MAGKIIADTLETGAGADIATSYVVNGSAKAWVNLNGTGTIAARDSFNHSSLTDNANGDYTNTIASAMGNANYAVSLANTQGEAASTNSAIGIRTTGTAGDDPASTYSTTSQRTIHRISSGSSGDITICCISVLGDLA
jgi:hypothetical protein